MEDTSRGEMVNPKDIAQIKVIVIAGCILAVLSGVISTGYTVYRLDARLDTMAEMRKRDALRIQGNLHDIACTIDSMRDAMWNHLNPKQPPPYSKLGDRIPDIPRVERDKVNSHIGSVPLETRH